jgi:integrase
MATETKKKPTQRAHGEGTIQHRPDGSYYGQLSLGTVNGKRIRRTFSGPTRQAVADAMAEARRAWKRGEFTDTSAVTVEAQITNWLDARTDNEKIKAASKGRYQQVLRTYLSKSIGSTPIQKLNPLMIEDALKTAKIPPKSQRWLAFVILNSACKDAVKKNILTQNPCDRITPPPNPGEKAIEIHPWTLAETKAFMAAIAGNRYEPILTLAIMTGARVNELTTLKWEDYDRQAKTLYIRRTLSGTNVKAQIVTDTKTKKSKRTLALNRNAVDAIHLQEKNGMRDGCAGKPWIFCHADGRRYRDNTILKNLRKFAKAAGIRMIRTHDLRHTWASLQIENGASTKEVSEQLGHADCGFTANTYAHVTDKMRQQGVERLDRMYG